MGTFSKILAPGLRLGWIQADEAALETLLQFGVLKSGGGFNPFTTRLITAALQQGQCDRYLAHIKSLFAHRVQLMDRQLQQSLGDILEYEKPSGGYFFWLKLPKKTDATELAEKAREIGTGFRAGPLFSTKKKFKNFIRLSFAHYSENSISVGLDRLSTLLKKELK